MCGTWCSGKSKRRRCPNFRFAVVVSAAVGCVVGMAIEFGSYDNENIGPALNDLDGFNNVRDVWTRAFSELGSE